jgi:hypothetical protein
MFCTSFDFRKLSFDECLGIAFVGKTRAGQLATGNAFVFGSAKLFAELFERLKQPAIVGEIPAGVLIGPSILGWILC